MNRFSFSTIASRIGLILCLCVALKATPAWAITAYLYPDIGTTTSEIYYYWTMTGYGYLIGDPITELATLADGSDAWQEYVFYTFDGGTTSWHGSIDGFSGAEPIYIRVHGDCYGGDGTYDTGWARFSTLPTPPTIESTDLLNSNQVHITWSTPDDPDNLNGFEVYRSIYGGAFNLLWFCSSYDIETWDTDLVTSSSAELNEVTYLVVAYNLDYTISETDPQEAPESYDEITVGYFAPTNFSPTDTEDGIQLQWTDNSVSNPKYKIYRRQSGGTWATLTSQASGSATQYLDDAVQYLWEYEYKIQAFDPDNSMYYSMESDAIGPIKHNYAK
ncbi:MAG: hypothetical protein M1457_13955 [bacterium]|nr:hypothetical protein [bacterium]